MKRSTVTMAAGLLFTAAALKLVFPGGLKRTAAREEPTAVYEVSHTVSMQDAAGEPVTVTINAAEYLGADADPVPAEELPAAVAEAVETFLSQQEPYAGLAVPANVSYSFSQPSFVFCKPVRAEVSSGFGYRVHPLENLTKFHYGTDLAAMSGDDIRCFASGLVTEVGENDTLGKYIRVSHDEGYATLYAHCGTVYVARGQAVGAGEKIGLVGATGKVTGPHLHFELTRDGVFLNPEFYMAAL